MGKYNGPKDRLSRREGVDLFGKGTKLSRLNILPGVHGPKGVTKAQSQYGKQLREKQKVKRMYGVLEKQFAKYVEMAFKSKGNTGEALLSLLEMRLDNVIYRLSFAKTRPMARQMVSHRHILVNGNRVNIPSYLVKVGDVVTISAKTLDVPNFKKVLEFDEYTLPAWLERKGFVGKISKKPTRSDIVEPIFEQDIVEFYSR